MSDSEIKKELEKIKQLLALLLYYNDIPPLEIAKAANMSPNTIYGFISAKKSKNKISKSKNSLLKTSEKSS